MALEGLKSHGRIFKPSGSHAVGCTDVMTSPGAEGIFFRLFYPTAAVEGAEAANWLPDKNYLKGYAKYFKMWPPLFTYLFPLFVGEIDVPAFWSTPPLNDGKQKFPVVVFSHGLGACRTTYSTICLELASNGYVVAAVEHRDYSASTSFYFEDGDDKSSSELESSAKQYNLEKKKKKYIFMKEIRNDPQEPSIRNKQVHIRSKECSLVMDWLHRMNNGEDVKSVLNPLFSLSSFQGILDFSKASIGGHSFGGATAIITMLEDKRFKAGFGLDPWMLPFLEESSPLNDITQQMLFINTEIFQTDDDLRVLRKIKSSGPERLEVCTLKGTLHLNQTDVPFICRGTLRWYLGSQSRLDRFVAMDLTTRLTLVFLSKHLDLPVNENYANFITTHQDVIWEGIPDSADQIRKKKRHPASSAEEQKTKA